MTVTGASGLSVTYGGTTNASISNSGALTCASISTCGAISSNGNTGIATAYNTLFCGGQVSSTGTIVSNNGRVSYKVATSSTGVYILTHASAYPSTKYTANATAIGFGNLAGLGSNNASTTKLEVTVFSGANLTNGAFFCMVF